MALASEVEAEGTLNVVISVTENYANQDLKKTERWATDNKIEFNDNISKVLFISMKRNDDREVNIYLNYKRLDQKRRNEIFRNILR
jgi:hypothetical protein